MNLFLNQPVFHRPRLFLKPGNLGLELLVLILEMAQAGLHLTRRRTTSQYAFSPRSPSPKKSVITTQPDRSHRPLLEPSATGRSATGRADVPAEVDPAITESARKGSTASCDQKYRVRSTSESTTVFVNSMRGYCGYSGSLASIPEVYAGAKLGARSSWSSEAEARVRRLTSA